MGSQLSELRPATSLYDVYKTMSPAPLCTPEELAAFYRAEVNTVRGDDRVARLKLGLERSYGSRYYQAFLMGHPGVGKSTELTRLVEQVRGKFNVIRLSAVQELDPVAFQPFDVLLVMMSEIAERTADPVKDGGADTIPPASLLQGIWEWFAIETSTHSEETKIGAEVSAGIEPTALMWWAKVVGLFAKIRGEMKYASVRKAQVTEKQLGRLSSLIDLANELLDFCNASLAEKTGREWLFIAEDFDKPGIPSNQIENLFLTYANVFKDLHVHLVITIPIALGYSTKSVQLPFPNDRIFCIPDTPVYRRDHTAHTEGRAAVQAVLEARVDPSLFEQEQMMRLIVASGGNLRDLFSLVTQAADNAILRGAGNGKINASDADMAITNLRTDYERRLGESPYDGEPIAYERKAERLLAIYGGDPAAQIPDAVLYSLLRSRAVQEFNGRRWFGVHPLVVDILSSQERISVPAGGTVPGGTE